MNAVVDIYAPVFALGLLGYASARFGFFTRAHADGLEKFVFDFAVPLLLFRTLAQAEPLNNPPWRLLLGYYAPMALCYCIGVALCAALQRNANRKRAFAERIIGGFACSYGNAILLGLPLALLTFDADGQLAYFILLAFHSLTAFATTTVLLEYGRARVAPMGERCANALRGVLGNPIILGALAGLAFNWSGAQIPAPLDRLAELMQRAVTPCALFALGAALTGYGIAGRLTQTAPMILVKCVAFPLMVWFGCRYLFELTPLWSAAATLLAAQPAGVNVYFFAARYNAARAEASSVVFLSTVFSLLSIPTLLYWIELNGWR